MKHQLKFNLRREKKTEYTGWQIVGDFSVKSALKKLRVKDQKAEWYNIVLGRGYVPRYAMILWLLCKGRLNTKDSLIGV